MKKINAAYLAHSKAVRSAQWRESSDSGSRGCTEAVVAEDVRRLAEGEDVEHYEWMNDQVRKEIEDLQRTYGFDEDEALAYWHLRHAGTLLLAMRRTDAPEPAEGDESVRLARMIHGRSQIESNILQHLSALRRELGDRVLRRSYPEGWGSAHNAIDE